MSANTVTQIPNKAKNKKSMWGEFSLLSSGMLAGLIALCILSVIFYAYMSASTPKKVVVTDNAGIFTKAEENELETAAKRLSKSKDINVVIITTRDKNEDLKQRFGRYTDSDEDCNQFAKDYYDSKCVTHQLRDNSGICILIDLTIDEPGMRYFRMYTNGTAYFAVSNEECDRIFRTYKSELTEGQYFDALSNVLRDLKNYDFSSLGFVTFICLIVPMIITLIACSIVLRKGKLDPAPKYKEYLEGTQNVDTKESFLRQKVVVTYDSSSSGGGGGFSGGGGGGFSGGGGHSGGGGGRF